MSYKRRLNKMSTFCIRSNKSSFSEIISLKITSTSYRFEILFLKIAL